MHQTLSDFHKPFENSSENTQQLSKTSKPKHKKKQKITNTKIKKVKFINHNLQKSIFHRAQSIDLPYSLYSFKNVPNNPLPIKFPIVSSSVEKYKS